MNIKTAKSLPAGAELDYPTRSSLDRPQTGLSNTKVNMQLWRHSNDANTV